MYSSQAQGLARFGGALLAFSLVLPFFALSILDFNAVTFRLWTLDKGAFAVIAAFAVFALAQVKLADRDTTALIYMVVGALFTAALVYKLWISPPGSAPIGDLAGADQSVTVNGKSTAVSSISTRELLDAIGIHQKATYGAYIATIGAAFVAIAAFLEWRSSSAEPAQIAYDPHAQFAGGPEYAQQAYAPQVPPPAAAQAQAVVPAQPAFAPDPFAPPAAAAAPAAPAPVPRAAEVTPATTPAVPPTRPPGS